MPHPYKSGQTPTFGLVRVDREGFVTQSAGMGHKVLPAAHRPPKPGIDQVHRKRSMHTNRGMQCIRRLPSPVAHTRYKLARHAGWRKRHRRTVDRNLVTRICHATHPQFEALHR